MRFRNNSEILQDPFRFAGDGVDFKAKLIGFQDVDEPRGDQMCQDAIQTCKAIVKRKGEHKLRILFNVSLEGLKIKEQHGGKVLHTFPVSKVSFIAKDVADNRAFGFVYGVSEGQHKFYGIKTEKTSDVVVFSIRDMFQIVYEMKKKQIELAKQQQDDEHVVNENEIDVNRKNIVNGSEKVPVANLLDLETELENLEQGMQNMEKWTATFDDSTENGSSHSPSTPPSVAGVASDVSSGWATTSLSSSALNESNDPFADHLFTSSTNSFGSAGPFPKEPFVPPPPVSSNSRRASHPNGHSTLFGGAPDPFGDPFENGFSHTTSNNSSNVFVLAQQKASGSSSTATDPFDTSYVNTMIHNGVRNANLLDVNSVGVGHGGGGGVKPLTVSTPLQAKQSSASWLTNGIHQPPSLMDSSQCLSAIQANTFDDFSANGSGVFNVNGNSSTSKMESSIFNNAATDSSLFQTSSNGCSGPLHDSSSNGDLFNGARFVIGNVSSPLSIANSSGSQSPRSPSMSKPNSLGRSLTNGSSSMKQHNGAVDVNVVNGHNIRDVDDAFAKLCNLDTLVITPSRSPQQQSNGFVVHESRSTPPKRDDPFAHLKYKPKKTINELRELTAGPSLEVFEMFNKNGVSDLPKDTVRSSPLTILSSPTSFMNGASPVNGNNSASPPRPPIPPRSGQNFPAIPRPDVSGGACGLGLRNGVIGHQRSGLLPPPSCGSKLIEPTKQHNDPFADEFFA